MDNPKVSVIIPSYNRFESLLNSIKSVEEQDYENYEIIVINDGSTDPNYKSYEFSDKIKLIHLKENQKSINGFGPGAIRNFGVNQSNGKYIAFLDDDDYWLPEKLRYQISKLENSHYKFSSTEGLYGEGPYNSNESYSLYNKEFFYEDIKYKYRKTKYLKNNSFPEIWDSSFLEIHNCVITSSVIVEKSILDILGGFRGVPMWSDYDCWLGLLKLSDLIYIDRPLFYYDGLHFDGKNYFK
tara:strand:- start:769 stop:1488 length:720 start_codon:yes stop_codon:yes gene_type:complete